MLHVEDEIRTLCDRIARHLSFCTGRELLRWLMLVGLMARAIRSTGHGAGGYVVRLTVFRPYGTLISILLHFLPTSGPYGTVIQCDRDAPRLCRDDTGPVGT